MSRLDGRVAVVTGGGRGIGLAIVKRFVARGATVVIGELDADLGAQAAAEVGATFIEADIADAAQATRLVDLAVEEHGRIDVLVNNAGTTKFLGLLDITVDDWDRMHHVNARGTFFALQAAARYMIDQGGGRIINIASIAGKGYRGTSNPAYAASKGAVLALTRVVAAHLAKDNVTVNAVCPGITRTALLGGADQDDATLKRMERSVPLGRLNDPDDIAALVEFLASDDAANVTGQAWNVDGGLVFD